MGQSGGFGNRGKTETRSHERRGIGHGPIESTRRHGDQRHAESLGQSQQGRVIGLGLERGAEGDVATLAPGQRQTGIDQGQQFGRRSGAAKAQTYNDVGIGIGPEPGGRIEAGGNIFHHRLGLHEAGPLKTGAAPDLVPPLVDRTGLCFSSVMGTLRWLRF